LSTFTTIKSFIEQRGTRTPNVIDNWITARLLTN
jgi:hypothetical protein